MLIGHMVLFSLVCCFLLVCDILKTSIFRGSFQNSSMLMLKIIMNRRRFFFLIKFFFKFCINFVLFLTLQKGHVCVTGFILKSFYKCLNFTVLFFQYSNIKTIIENSLSNDLKRYYNNFFIIIIFNHY